MERIGDHTGRITDETEEGVGSHCIQQMGMMQVARTGGEVVDGKAHGCTHSFGKGDGLWLLAQDVGQHVASGPERGRACKGVPLGGREQKGGVQHAGYLTACGLGKQVAIGTLPARECGELPCLGREPLQIGGGRAGGAQTGCIGQPPAALGHEGEGKGTVGRLVEERTPRLVAPHQETVVAVQGTLHRVGIIMGARYWDVPGQEMLEGPQCGTERTALEEGELPLLPASQAGGQLLGHAFPARGLGPRTVVDILGCCTALAQGLGQCVGLEHGAVVGLTMERYNAYLHGVFFLKNCGTARTQSHANRGSCRRAHLSR